MTTELVDELDKTNRPPVEVAIDLAHAALRTVVTVSRTSQKDPGLIASEADILNAELRMANRDHEQVVPRDDWRSAIRGLVEGVRAGENFHLRKMQAIAEEAWTELIVATRQMMPEDDQIICDHVKRAEGLLCALVTGNKLKEEK